MDGDVDRKGQEGVSLREHIEQRLEDCRALTFARLEDHCSLNEARFDALEEAFQRGLHVIEAQLKADRDVTAAKFLVQNEWRASIVDLRGTFAAQTTVIDLEKLVRTGFEALNNRLAALELKLSVVGETTALNGAEVKSLSEKMDSRTETLGARAGELEGWRNNMEGRFTAYAAGFGLLVVVVGFVLKYV